MTKTAAEVIQKVSDRAARSTFTLVKSSYGSYRIDCGNPDHNLGVWDFRQNALNKGYAHAKLAHGIESPRTEWAAGIRLFQEPTTTPEQK